MRAAVAALAVAVLLAPTSASAHRSTVDGGVTPRWSGPCSSSRYEVRRSMSADEVERRVRALIRCAGRWRSWPEGVETAYRIAYAESRFGPWAHNVDGCEGYGCRGVFQFHGRYWATWYERYIPPRFFPRHDGVVSPFDVRANVLVALLMSRDSGWSPWSTYR